MAPITLDSMTSGFNISRDKTRDVEFNEMMGFTKRWTNRVNESTKIFQKKHKKHYYQ